MRSCWRLPGCEDWSSERATSVLDAEIWLPALAQGALAIEMRDQDANCESVRRRLMTRKPRCRRLRAWLSGGSRRFMPHAHCRIAIIENHHLRFRGENFGARWQQIGRNRLHAQIGIEPSCRSCPSRARGGSQAQRTGATLVCAVADARPRHPPSRRFRRRARRTRTRVTRALAPLSEFARSMLRSRSSMGCRQSLQQAATASCVRGVCRRRDVLFCRRREHGGTARRWGLSPRTSAEGVSKALAAAVRNSLQPPRAHSCMPQARTARGDFCGNLPKPVFDVRPASFMRAVPCDQSPTESRHRFHRAGSMPCLCSLRKRNACLPKASGVREWRPNAPTLSRAASVRQLRKEFETSRSANTDCGKTRSSIRAALLDLDPCVRWMAGTQPDPLRSPCRQVPAIQSGGDGFWMAGSCPAMERKEVSEEP